MTETHALSRTVDEAGDVGHDEALLVVRLDHAEHRRNRREVVLRNLRPRSRDRRDETGLAHAWITHEAHIREQLQLEDETFLLARLAELGKRRRAVRSRGKLRIAATAAPPLGDNGLLTDLREIRKHFARGLVLNDGTRRYLHVAGRRIVAVLVLDIAVLTVLRLELAMIAEIQQRVQILVDDKDDVAATAAVAACRTAFRDELLPAER